MYVDTAHNSPSTAYANVYRGLLVVALKFQAYVQEWGVDARRKSSFLYSQSHFEIDALEPGADRALALKNDRQRAAGCCIPVVGDCQPGAVCQSARARGRDDVEAELGHLVRSPDCQDDLFDPLSLTFRCATRLGLHAFHRVLSRRPAVYSPLLKTLARDLRGPMYGGARVHLQKVVGHASTAFADRGNGERKARMS